MTVSLSVIVLTLNEESNLEFLLKSVAGWAARIFVVDSGSTDATVSIAEHYGASIFHHPWTTHAEQLNWALENLPIETEWVMRMDADEIVTPELAAELAEKLPGLPPEVAGLLVKRRVYFLGRWIRHGSYYPTWLLRIFRKGQGQCEQLQMDEHIVLTQGEARRLKHDIIDYNRKGLSFWTVKHDGYAGREALDQMRIPLSEHGPNVATSLLSGQVTRKRWLKTNLYGRVPLFWRALGYFLYRYILRLGFLDGTEGLIFHVLQGFWYRFYVDARLWEMRHKGDLSQ